MKRMLVLVVLIGSLFSGTSLFAQDATPEATAEIERTLSEIFASLPQSRSEDGGFVVGEPDAPITIIEFADFACPHCQNYRPIIEQVIIDYVATGQAKFEFRIFPTAGGQYTYFAGQALECINHQNVGLFWQAYEVLYDYAENGDYDETIAQQLSDEYGLDYQKLLNCIQFALQTQTDIQLAQELGVSGTPAVMMREGDEAPQFITLGSRTYSSGGVAYEVLAEIIEAANAEPEAI